MSKIKQLEKRIAELEAALSQYSDSSNWLECSVRSFGDGGRYRDLWGKLEDGYKLAAKVLEKKK